MDADTHEFEFKFITVTAERCCYSTSMKQTNVQSRGHKEGSRNYDIHSRDEVVIMVKVYKIG